MALPTFFIIGAPKAGTTSLNFYLEQHPEIQMSEVKEPAFFAPPLGSATSKLGLSRVDMIDSLDRYERLFDPTMRVRGEGSTNYAEYPFRQGVPERIKERVPEAKFIYMVRDPVARTVSHYDHLVASAGERRPLAEIMSDLPDPRAPCICASLYAMQLELYLHHFSQERMLVIDQADLRADRRSTLSRIFSFLAVDEEFDTSRFNEELLKGNEHRAYPPDLARFVSHTVRPLSRRLPLSPDTRRRLRLSLERTLLPPLQTSKLDGELRARLREFYTGEVERLRVLTGKAFPTWSI
jgi:hypothetical protein